jgi:hypothetical protein
MNSIRFISLFTLLLICGCPLNSKIPLSNPNPDEFDKGLPGLWKFVPKDKDDEAMLVTISQFNKSEYLIVARKIKEAGEEEDPEELLIRMFITRIGKARFWNFQVLEKGLTEREFSFGQYSMKDGRTFHLRMVRNKLFKDYKETSSAALYAAFEKFIGHKDFLQDALIFRRLEEQ